MEAQTASQYAFSWATRAVAFDLENQYEDAVDAYERAADGCLRAALEGISLSQVRRYLTYILLSPPSSSSVSEPFFAGCRRCRG